jgi:hypothetical protein
MLYTPLLSHVGTIARIGHIVAIGVRRSKDRASRHNRHVAYNSSGWNAAMDVSFRLLSSAWTQRLRQRKWRNSLTP